jgi:hypothetical protein
MDTQYKKRLVYAVCCEDSIVSLHSSIQGAEQRITELEFEDCTPDGRPSLYDIQHMEIEP